MSEFFSSVNSNREERAVLRQAGLRELEIDKLCLFRRAYKPNKQDQLVLEPNVGHLLFLRWLKEKGRLTEESV